MTPAWLPDTVTSDLGRALHYTLLWGLDAVVLRTVGGPSERVPFVNEARLTRRLAESDVPVVAVDPGLFEGPASARASALNDLDALAETLAFCERIGCPCVVVGALAPEEPLEGASLEAAAGVLRQAGEAAASEGRHLAVRNAWGSGVATGAALARLIGAIGHPAVQAAWSPYDALQAGERPETGLRALLDAPAQIGLVFTRDLGTGARDVGTGEGADEEADALPGEGAVGWGEHVRALGEAGYRGPLVLEVHGRPVGTFGLRAASALVGLARAGKRAAPRP